MPVCVYRNSSNQNHPAVTFEPGLEFRENSARCIEIGLLNNMPDSALQSTERQFLTLLDSAADNVVVRLSLYALPDVPRSESGRAHIDSIYSDFDRLLDRRLDGLIITGTEPRSADLRDEPYWGSLTRAIDWAENNTNSTVLSCLAAHAAVLHLDGITRKRLDDKRFGLFECSPVADHHLTTQLPSPVRMPHSRWNDLPEQSLKDCGYEVLTRSTEAGADAFVKERRNLMVFFQGHPEYEANTLLLEYRRDVGRYLKGQRETYPAMPNCYFDSNTLQALSAFQSRAISNRGEHLLSELPISSAEASLAPVWRPAAVRMYRGWLAYLCADKERRLRQGRSRIIFGEEDEVRGRRRAAAG